MDMSWWSSVEDRVPLSSWWEMVEPRIVPVAIVVGVVALVLLGARTVWRLRVLKGRTVRRVILPSSQFNPNDEEVMRFAAVMSRVHRVTRSPLARDAYAVRLLWTADADGLVRFEVHGHRRAQSVLEMLGYANTESLTLDDVGIEDQVGDVDSFEEAR